MFNCLEFNYIETPGEVETHPAPVELSCKKQQLKIDIIPEN